MSNLILEVKMNRLRAFHVFPQSIKIYEDIMVFRKRSWFNVEEMTITYNHVASANLKAGLFFSTLEIITSGGSQNPFVKHIYKPLAAKAQKLIEQKIFRVHSTNPEEKEFKAEKDTKLTGMEKSLSRLVELKRRGRISDREYDKKRKIILRSLGK